MEEKNNLSFLPHLFSLLQSFIAPIGLIGVIITYVAGDNNLKKKSIPALNWQISLLLYTIISGILIFVLIGFLFLFILWVLNTIFSIIALIKSSDEETWIYPLSIKFIK